MQIVYLGLAIAMMSVAAAAGAASPTAASTAAPQTASTTPLVLDTPLNVPPALADALDESKLPSDIPGLLAELSARAEQVESLINAGSLGEVWLPASGTKTVALVLDRKSSALTGAAHSSAVSAARRIVVASWALDNYGDLGNREQIAAAYADMASAINDLKSAYTAP